MPDPPPVHDPAPVAVQDHSFFLGDVDAPTAFETMDYATGLAGAMASAALLYAGVDRGTVGVTATALDHPPGLDTAGQWQDLADWDDVAEISLHVPRGALTIAALETGPADTPPDLPLLSPHGPGHYRVRIHASGRDRHYDQVVDDSGEHFHLVTWPAPPAPPLIIKATSHCGYGLRLAAHQHPPAAEPAPATPEQQDETAHQATLRQALLDWNR